MAKSTTTFNLTPTWVQASTAAQTVLVEAHGNAIYYKYSATTPAVGDVGHILDPLDDPFGDATQTEAMWIRSVGPTALAVVTTE